MTDTPAVDSETPAKFATSRIPDIVRLSFISLMMAVSYNISEQMSSVFWQTSFMGDFSQNIFCY